MISHSKMPWKPAPNAILRCAAGPVGGIIAKFPLLLCMLFLVGCPSSQPPKAASEETAAATPSNASITATPNPVPAGIELDTTTITWDTGDGSEGLVSVAENGAEEKPFARGSRGSQEAPWIRTGVTYEFRLYAGSSQSAPRASVRVSRGDQ